MSDACNDKWTLSWHEDLQIGDGTKKNTRCWDDSMGAEKHIAFWECHRGYGNQLYKYWPETQVLINLIIDSPGLLAWQISNLTNHLTNFFSKFITQLPGNAQWHWLM